jgi:hypothetical protein
VTDISLSTELGPFLTSPFGERYLYNVNRSTFQQEKSSDLFHRIYPELLTRRDSLSFILGTDSGLLLNYLKEREMPDGSLFVFIEFQEIITLLQKEGLLDNLPEQIFIFNQAEVWNNLEALHFTSYVLRQNIILHRSSVRINGWIFEYQILEEKFTQTLKQQGVEHSEMASLATFIPIALRNCSENKHHVSLLANIFSGKTAVVLGGGPSFDSMLPWVKENRDKLIIISVARISKQLHAAEITPHFVVAVDPIDIGFDHAREMLYFQDSSIFIHSYHVAPRLLSQWGGLSFFYGSRFPWNSKLNNTDAMSSGSTVTNAALGFAAYTGCAVVVFGGVDFCFSQTGISHAAGSYESLSGPSLNDTLPVKTNDGHIASSRKDYLKGKADMEKQAAQLTARGLRIINPHGWSARMEHVEYLKFSEIPLSLLEKSPVERAHSTISTANNKQNSLKHYKATGQELSRIRKQLEGYKKLFHKALRCNDGLFGRNGKQADYSYKVEMDNIEEQLSQDDHKLYTLLKILNLKNIMRSTRSATAEEWSDEEIEQAGREYYEACTASAAELISLIQHAVKINRMRIAEEQLKPNFKELVTFWRAENQQGRVRVWKRQHPEEYEKLEENPRILLDKIDREFEAIFTEQETSYLKRNRQVSSLEGVAATSLRYFLTKDRAALQRLQQGLKVHPDQKRAEKLSLFTRGLLLELDGKAEEASANYQQLLGEEKAFLTEESLKRLFSIFLDQGNLQSAVTAAECLTQISVSYAPRLAEIYEIAGELPAALDIYTQYLKHVGSHVPTMQKMAKLYLKSNLPEGAVMMSKFILEQEPGNSTARRCIEDNS